MKLTYKYRLFLWFFVIFVLFAFIMVTVEQHEEKGYKTLALESKLNGYTDILHSYIKQNEGINKVDSLVSILPSEIRVTIIRNDGTVAYDKDFADVSKLENHLNRPEIMKALYQHSGTDIRVSSSTDREYLYYANYYSPYYIRVALPYDIQTKSILSPDRMFIYIAILVLLSGVILLNLITGRFGKSISNLKHFATNLKEGKPLPTQINFPKDELGEAGEELLEVFKQKEKQEMNLRIEREKLIHHFQFSREGLCIFNPDHTKIYANTHFIRYLNFILDDLSLNTNAVFSDKVFLPLQQFLENYMTGTPNNFSMQLNRNGKIMDIQTVIFEDLSFEITIKDVTELEQTRLLKQEMTNNIAHELKTPVTSLRAILETLSEQELPAEKKSQFIHRAHIQSVRLSNLVNDVSLISKMEELSTSFKLEKLNIAQIIDDVRIDLIDKLSKNNIQLNLLLKNKGEIKGNYTLIYSIFRNLIDNSIDHAGKDILIFIDNYTEDDTFLYFSYYDTGKGLDEKHLNRLFERFYRADEGRTRDSGGSGLGLSIVRNAVKFHYGEIQVKNHKGAGLEFLFTLKKNVLVNISI